MPRARKTVKKQFVVAELGTGVTAQKITTLALAHPKVQFVGVDIVHVKYGQELKKHGLKEKPKNLTIKSRMAAIKFLHSQPRESLSHVFEHYTLNNLRFLERRWIMGQVLRCLKNGGRFTILTISPFQSQFEKELRENGFDVRAKRLAANDIKKIGGGLSLENYEYVTQFFGEIGKIHDLKLRQRVLEIQAETARKRLRLILENIEGKFQPAEVRQAIDRISAGAAKILTKKPFAVIYARKPRKRS